MVEAMYLRFYFNMAWMAVQVVLAAVNVKLIDHYGVQINEQLRTVMPVLSRRCQLPFERTTDDIIDANFVVCEEIFQLNSQKVYLYHKKISVDQRSRPLHLAAVLGCQCVSFLSH